ncbi:MAG: late competence development ComFB family protein [Treponema sp.]|jgi:competence protein ComFB|nr:late competence development ComFB family protein [Treponema sp.]
MAFIDNYDLENLRNEAERLIFEEISKQIEAFPAGEICTCNECIIDIAAIALNGVKPFYRHSLLGTLYALEALNIDAEYAESIRVAVTQAIEKVKNNPAHI